MASQLRNRWYHTEHYVLSGLRLHALTCYSPGHALQGNQGEEEVPFVALLRVSWPGGEHEIRTFDAAWHLMLEKGYEVGTASSTIRSYSAGTGALTLNQVIVGSIPTSGTLREWAAGILGSFVDKKTAMGVGVQSRDQQSPLSFLLGAAVRSPTSYRFESDVFRQKIMES